MIYSIIFIFLELIWKLHRFIFLSYTAIDTSEIVLEYKMDQFGV